MHEGVKLLNKLNKGSLAKKLRTCALGRLVAKLFNAVSTSPKHQYIRRDLTDLLEAPLDTDLSRFAPRYGVYCTNWSNVDISFSPGCASRCLPFPCMCPTPPNLSYFSHFLLVYLSSIIRCMSGCYHYLGEQSKDGWAEW